MQKCRCSLRLWENPVALETPKGSHTGALHKHVTHAPVLSTNRCAKEDVNPLSCVHQQRLRVHGKAMGNRVPTTEPASPRFHSRETQTVRQDTVGTSFRLGCCVCKKVLFVRSHTVACRRMLMTLPPRKAQTMWLKTGGKRGYHVLSLSLSFRSEHTVSLFQNKNKDRNPTPHSSVAFPIYLKFIKCPMF